MYDSQNKKLLRHLKEYGSITSMEAVNEYGIMRLAARISDLRRAGYPIISNPTKGKNRFGDSVHYTTYSYAEKEKI